MDAKKIGFAARCARERRIIIGMTQAELAAATGLRRETIYRLERGRVAHADTIARVAAALGVKVGEFIEAGDNHSPLHGHPDCTPIRDRRRELGLTLAECASAAGVSVTTLSRFERGNHHYPSICDVDTFDLALPIHNEGLARILQFANADELTNFWREREYAFASAQLASLPDGQN